MSLPHSALRFGLAASLPPRAWQGLPPALSALSARRALPLLRPRWPPGCPARRRSEGLCPLPGTCPPMCTWLAVSFPEVFVQRAPPCPPCVIAGTTVQQPLLLSYPLCSVSFTPQTHPPSSETTSSRNVSSDNGTSALLVPGPPPPGRVPWAQKLLRKRLWSKRRRRLSGTLRRVRSPGHQLRGGRWNRSLSPPALLEARLAAACLGSCTVTPSQGIPADEGLSPQVNDTLNHQHAIKVTVVAMLS